MRLKYRLNMLLLDVAFRFPFLFTKTFQFFANEYHSQSEYILSKKSEQPEFKKTSFLESNFHWKAMSFTCFINSDELNKLKIWKEKQSLWFNSPAVSKLLDTRSFDREGGWVNIGLIRIDQESFTDDLNSIYMNSPYLDSAYISLKKYPSGLSVLTFYILFKPNVTELVKLVPAPKITEFIKINNLNFFSRRLTSVSLSDERNFLESFLKENMRNVYKESCRFFDIISREIGIKKGNDELYCMSDIYLDQKPPYFDRHPQQGKKDLLIFLPRGRYFSDARLSDNNDESFILDPYVNVGGVDMTYLKICEESTFDEYNNFRKKHCLNNESHLAIIPLLLIIKKIDKLSNEISKLKIYNKSGSMIKLHKNLFSIVHDLELIDEWINILNENIPLSLPAGYKDKSDSILKAQGRRVLSLKKTVKTFYSLSENRVQISNLHYNKRYSVIVFIFIIIQVFLAALTIDWGKTNVWYTPIFSWVKNLF